MNAIQVKANGHRDLTSCSHFCKLSTVDTVGFRGSDYTGSQSASSKQSPRFTDAGERRIRHFRIVLPWPELMVVKPQVARRWSGRRWILVDCARSPIFLHTSSQARAAILPADNQACQISQTNSITPFKTYLV